MINVTKFLKYIIILVMLSILTSCGGGGISNNENNDSPQSVFHLGHEAFYSFDEATGSKVYNSNFDELHGQITLVQRVPGKVNRALSFSGGDVSNVFFPSTEANASGPPVNISFSGNSISIEAWVQFKELDPDISYHLFGNANSNGLQSFIYQINNKQIQFLISPEENGRATVELLKSNYLFELNTWYHIAFTYDESRARIYVNGEVHAQKSIILNVQDYVNRLYLGGGSDSKSFSGIIDEVRFSTRLRSENDIRSYYNATK